MNQTILISILTLLSAQPALAKNASKEADAPKEVLKKPSKTCITDYKQNLDPATNPQGAALKRFEDVIAHGPMMPSIWVSEAGTQIELVSDATGKLTMTVKGLSEGAFKYELPGASLMPVDTYKSLEESALAQLHKSLEGMKEKPSVSEIKLCLEIKKDGSEIFTSEPVKGDGFKATLTAPDENTVNVDFVSYKVYHFNESLKRATAGH